VLGGQENVFLPAFAGLFRGVRYKTQNLPKLVNFPKIPSLMVALQLRLAQNGQELMTRRSLQLEKTNV
jgi:hypothetical protein